MSKEYDISPIARALSVSVIAATLATPPVTAFAESNNQQTPGSQGHELIIPYREVGLRGVVFDNPLLPEAQTQPDESFQIIEDPSAIPITAVTERRWAANSKYKNWELIIANSWDEYENIAAMAGIPVEEAYRKRFNTETMLFATAGERDEFGDVVYIDSIRHEFLPADHLGNQTPGISIKLSTRQERHPAPMTNYPYTVAWVPNDQILEKITATFVDDGAEPETKIVRNPVVFNTKFSKYKGEEERFEVARSHNGWEGIKDLIGDDVSEYDMGKIRLMYFLGAQPNERKNVDFIKMMVYAKRVEVIFRVTEAPIGAQRFNYPGIVIDMPISIDPNAEKEIVPIVVSEEDCSLLIVGPGDPIPPYPRCRDAGLLSN